MITGEINFAGEAVVRLEVGNESGGREVLEAVVDTGFTGFLTLPGAFVDALSLPLLGSLRLLLLMARPLPWRSAKLRWSGMAASVR